MKKKCGLLAGILCLVFVLSGCASGNIAILNISNNGKEKDYRSCYYWSGSGDRAVVLEEGEKICFAIDMKKGTLTFTLEDEDGETVYELEKEGEYEGTETYSVSEAGTYRLVKKGEKFSGRYTVTWGEAAKTEEETAE